VDETSLIKLVRDIPPFGDQRHRKGPNTDLKPRRWDEIGRNETLRVSTAIITLLNYITVLTSSKGYYPSAKICPNHHHQTCTVHHVPFTSPTIRRLRKINPSVGRNLDRHVGLKVVIHVWRCMPKQMLVCCAVSVLAPT